MTKKTKEYLIQGDHYFPSTQSERSDTLPAGAYECRFTQEGIPFFEPIKITTDKIVDIPNSFTEKVVTEIEQFWSEGVSTKFAQYGLVHKRGLLLSGRPGTGKTITLAKTAEVVINMFNVVVLFNPPPQYITIYLRLIKDIEPDRKILVMWEEFDTMLNRHESELLSLLDGELQVGNIIYLATTNYLTRIPSRIKNRPSRFARIIEVGEPDEVARRAFLEHKLTSEDKITFLEPMVQASEGFVIDQLKDLIISVCCFGYPIADAVMKIKEMQEDSMGADDYHEAQAEDVFRTAGLVSNKGVRGPLTPLR